MLCNISSIFTYIPTILQFCLPLLILPTIFSSPIVSILFLFSTNSLFIPLSSFSLPFSFYFSFPLIVLSIHIPLVTYLSHSFTLFYPSTFPPPSPPSLFALPRILHFYLQDPPHSRNLSFSPSLCFPPYRSRTSLFSSNQHSHPSPVSLPPFFQLLCFLFYSLSLYFPHSISTILRLF